MKATDTPNVLVKHDLKRDAQVLSSNGLVRQAHHVRYWQGMQGKSFKTASR